MRTKFKSGKKCPPFLVLLLAIFFTACANLNGRGLVANQSSEAEIIEKMGKPALTILQGAEAHWFYPSAPFGTQTFVVVLNSEKRFSHVYKALTNENFAKIQKGQGKASVEALLGPSFAAETAYFKARDELVLSWKFCNSFNEVTFFDVLLDGKTETVRTTQQRPILVGRDGVSISCGQTV